LPQKVKTCVNLAVLCCFSAGVNLWGRESLARAKLLHEAHTAKGQGVERFLNCDNFKDFAQGGASALQNSFCFYSKIQ